MRTVLQAHEFQQLLRRAAALAAGAAAHLQRQLHVLQRGAPGQQRRVLEHEADVAVLARGLRRGRQHLDAAPAGLQQVGHHAQEGRLAAARGPQQREELALRHVEVEALDGGDVAALGEKAHADVAACNGGGR
jgi:hypothetical protein